MNCTLTAPKHAEQTVNITVTMNQAFTLSEVIFHLDNSSYEYKELREIGRELHREAKKLHK